MKDDIKLKVLDDLGELFKKDCPYIKNICDTWGSLINDWSDIIKTYTEEHQLMVILTKILPAEIHYGVEPFFGKMIPSEYKRMILGAFYIDYIHWQSDKSLFILENVDFTPPSSPDIWQALKSLLESIETHEYRDKFKFVYAEEIS